jgi:hypothetical protein
MQKKIVSSKLIIVNDTRAKGVIIISIFLLFVLIAMFHMIKNADTASLTFDIFGKKIITSNPIIIYISVILFPSIFIFLLLYSFRNLRKIIIDFDFRTVKIRGLSIQIFQKIFAFDEIKSIEFFEREIERNEEHWSKSIKITNVSDEVLYETGVSNIINYEKLEELCEGLFVVDYRVMYLEENL